MTLRVESTDRTEGRPSVRRVVFLPDDWRRRRTVIIEGVDDRGADGDVRYRVKLKPLVSRDADFAGVNAKDLRAVNKDDDGPRRAPAGRIQRAADAAPEKEARPRLDRRGRVVARPGAPADGHDHDDDYGHADRIAEPVAAPAADELFATGFALVGGF